MSCSQSRIGVAGKALALIGLLLLAAPSLAAAQTIKHRAENDVPVVMTEVARLQSYTEIHLSTLTPIVGVCWTLSGPDSPYLLAAGVRYKFIDGDYIDYCPNRTNYNVGERMVLRFAPLPGGINEFHLVEGEGGEHQLIDPTSSQGIGYWNFLHIKLN